MKTFIYNHLKITEFLNKKSSQAPKCAILVLPGLPASSKEIAFIKKHRESIFKVFDIFHITYPGYPTNNKGFFLQKNPADLVDAFVRYLKKNKKYEKVYVTGSSFGGSVVLYLNNADKIISISPVIDWKKLYKKTEKQNYETLKSYLIDNGYKISERGWNLLKTGRLFKKPTKKLLKNKSLMFVYGSEDKEIDLKNLKILIKKLKANFIEIKSREHLSLRKLPLSVIENIFSEIKRDCFNLYNCKYLYAVQKKIAEIKNNKNYDFIIYTGITGSLSLRCLTSLSDIDLIIITKRDKNQKLKKIFQNIQGKYGEVLVLNKKDYIEYFTLNIRGCHKFILLENLYINSPELKNLFLIKNKFISENKFLLLLFSLLELLRLLKFYKKSNDILTSQRHQIDSLGTIKWMLVSQGILNNLTNFKFNFLMKNLLENKIISQKEKLLIEKYFFESALSINKNDKKIKPDKELKFTIFRYIDFLLLQIQNFYQCKIRFQKKTLSLKLTKKSKTEYLNDIFTSLYSSNQKILINLYRKYKNKKTLVANIIFYFMTCNRYIPRIIAKDVASAEDSIFFRNIKRNLIEYNRFKNDKEILDILSRSSDKKIKYFARLAKKNKNSSNKVIRF